MVAAETPNRARVLVVEDDIDIQQALSRILEAEGYAVARAENGRTALAHLEGPDRPCLILLDLMMPVMDGWQFRSELKRDPALASIPVVILSAHTQADPTGTLDAASYLKKPIDLDRLLATVRRFCPEPSADA